MKKVQYVYFEDSWNESHTDYQDDWTDEIPKQKNKDKTVED